MPDLPETVPDHACSFKHQPIRFDGDGVCPLCTAEDDAHDQRTARKKAERELEWRRSSHAQVLLALGCADSLDGGAEVVAAVQRLRARADQAENPGP